MAKQVTQFDLLISCPSDVKEELEIIKETVDSFNRMYGSANNASIVTKHWPADSYPESGGHPQKLLNKQIVLDCDAAVAVFWTRFGTPTDKYGSGTEEEIEELAKSGKQVFLYFSDCPLNPSSIDHDQYQKVLTFRDKYRDKGIYGTYSNLDEFKRNFKNHLSLYFVKLLTDSDYTSINMVNSKLSVQGIVNGKVADQPIILRRNYSNSQFIQEKKDSINELFNQIKRIVLPVTVIESKGSVSGETTQLSKELASKLGDVAFDWQELVKSFSKFIPSKLIFDDNYKDGINTYAKDNNITVNDREFFCIGDLAKQQQPFGGGLGGLSPSYHFVGSDEEKNKYELIRKLSWKIDEYQQYCNYFTAIDDKFYLELALSNFGTTFDEDVDVKVFVEKGLLCIKDQIPFPGDDILKMVNKVIDSMFKSKKTICVDEYNGYPKMPAIPYVPPFGLNEHSYRDEVESNKNEYKSTLDATFRYDYFQNDNYEILRYNQKYIKQNTSVFFPSVLVFNGVPDRILYEISSKHYSEIIKGELHILENS
jgi:hypothetical protein